MNKNTITLPPTDSSLGAKNLIKPSQEEVSPNLYRISLSLDTVIGGWMDGWRRMILLFAILMAIVFLLLLLSGVFQVLQAIWELRQGDNRNVFIAKGMLGMALITIAFVAPYLLLYMSSITSIQQMQHFTTP